MTPQIDKNEQNFDPKSQGHLVTFGAQNIPKNRPFEAKNKAQTFLPRSQSRQKRFINSKE